MGAARALARRLAAAAGELPDWHGAPLGAAVGVALLGEDGTSPEALMGAAEEARFAATAAGVAVGPPGP
jgi:GGDEF domain-containing protein